MGEVDQSRFASSLCSYSLIVSIKLIPTGIPFILVRWDVSEQGQMPRVGMDERMETGARGNHLIVMYGQVGVELAGHALKAAVAGGVQLAGAPARADLNAGHMRGWIILDLPQPPARAADQESGTGQLRHRLRQLQLGQHRKMGARLDRPA